MRLAALEVKGLLLEMAAEQLKVPVSDLVFQDGVILAGGAPKTGHRGTRRSCECGRE